MSVLFLNLFLQELFLMVFFFHLLQYLLALNKFLLFLLELFYLFVHLLRMLIQLKIFLLLLLQTLTIFTFLLRKNPRLIPIQSHLFLQILNHLIPPFHILTQPTVLLFCLFLSFLNILIMHNTVFPSQNSISIILLKKLPNLLPVRLLLIMLNQPFPLFPQLLNLILLQRLLLHIPPKLILLTLKPIFLGHLPQIQMNLNVALPILIIFKELIFQTNDIIGLKCGWDHNWATIGLLPFILQMSILFK